VGAWDIKAAGAIPSLKRKTLAAVGKKGKVGSSAPNAFEGGLGESAKTEASQKDPFPQEQNVALSSIIFFSHTEKNIFEDRWREGWGGEIAFLEQGQNGERPKRKGPKTGRQYGRGKKKEGSYLWVGLVNVVERRGGERTREVSGGGGGG